MARRFTNVVFPVPGGPISSAAFAPGFHFESHSESASRASSLPMSWSILFGLYFSDHMLSERASDEDDEAHEHPHQRGLLYRERAFHVGVGHYPVGEIDER